MTSEPFWYAIVSKRAPVINKAIRRLDAAQEYADKARENYPDATDIEVVPLYRDACARAGDGNEPEPAAWLVTWKGEKHTYVHAHASEVPAVDQARIMGGKCEPLYRAAPAAAPAKLEDIEQYRMQMAAISTAALGYWKESDGILPDYDTVPLRDVAKLYAKYDMYFRLRHEAAAAPAVSAQAWQPIETAPKDGLPVLVIVADATQPQAMVAHWAAETWRCGLREDWDAGTRAPEYYGYVDGATHWMPLPAAPQTKEQP